MLCRGYQLQQEPHLLLGHIMLRLHGPTRVVFQPMVQENGSVAVQRQCFWMIQKPMPVFYHSVARHVGFDLSKILMPFSISLMITDLDSLNRLSSSSFQVKGVPGLSASRKSSMWVEAANAKDT